jgi:hypothetical protein
MEPIGWTGVERTEERVSLVNFLLCSEEPGWNLSVLSEGTNLFLVSRRKISQGRAIQEVYRA